MVSIKLTTNNRQRWKKSSRDKPIKQEEGFEDFCWSWSPFEEKRRRFLFFYSLLFLSGFVLVFFNDFTHPLVKQTNKQTKQNLPPSQPSTSPAPNNPSPQAPPPPTPPPLPISVSLPLALVPILPPVLVFVLVLFLVFLLLIDQVQRGVLDLLLFFLLVLFLRNKMTHLF